MDPLADSGEFIIDISAELERQVARAGRAMARLHLGQRLLAERPHVPDSLQRIAHAGINAATAADSTVERIARVIASGPEQPVAAELVLAAMRAVDGIESCAEMVEQAAEVLGRVETGRSEEARRASPGA